MNWNVVGALGELLGSLGVLITLMFLTVQVRYARREVRRSVRQNRSDTLRDLFLSRIGNPALARIYSRSGLVPAQGVMQKQFGLSDEESFLFMQDQLAWWQYTDQVVLDSADLTEGERHQFHTGLIRRYKGDLLGAAWFESVKGNLNPVSVRYVENVLKAADG